MSVSAKYSVENLSLTLKNLERNNYTLTAYNEKVESEDGDRKETRLISIKQTGKYGEKEIIIPRRRLTEIVNALQYVDDTVHYFD